MHDLFHYVGIEVKLLFAGLAGGLASITKEKELTKTQRFLTVLVGGLVSVYMTPVVGKLINMGDEVLYGLAFIVGYSGLRTVEWFIAKYFKKPDDENSTEDQNN